VLLATAWWAGAVGCSEFNFGLTGPSSTALAATGAGGAEPCQGGYPDGFCAAYANEPESCACADCAQSSLCQNNCMDDGQCLLMEGEDCTCKDCFFKAAACSPNPGNCNDADNACTAGESCLCANCTKEDSCTKHCVDNGECVPLFEGCSCKDCMEKMECKGSTTTSGMMTTVTAGGGGAGGAGGSGGASATSSTVGPTTSAGAGGAGGAGGSK